MKRTDAAMESMRPLKMLRQLFEEQMAEARNDVSQKEDLVRSRAASEAEMIREGTRVIELEAKVEALEHTLTSVKNDVLTEKQLRIDVEAASERLLDEKLAVEQTLRETEQKLAQEQQKKTARAPAQPAVPPQKDDDTAQRLRKAARELKIKRDEMKLRFDATVAATEALKAQMQAQTDALNETHVAEKATLDEVIASLKKDIAALQDRCVKAHSEGKAEAEKTFTAALGEATLKVQAAERSRTEAETAAAQAIADARRHDDDVHKAQLQSLQEKVTKADATASKLRTLLRSSKADHAKATADLQQQITALERRALQAEARADDLENKKMGDGRFDDDQPELEVSEVLVPTHDVVAPEEQQPPPEEDDQDLGEPAVVAEEVSVEMAPEQQGPEEQVAEPEQVVAEPEVAVEQPDEAAAEPMDEAAAEPMEPEQVEKAAAEPMDEAAAEPMEPEQVEPAAEPEQSAAEEPAAEPEQPAEEEPVESPEQGQPEEEPVVVVEPEQEEPEPLPAEEPEPEEAEPVEPDDKADGGLDEEEEEDVEEAHHEEEEPLLAEEAKEEPDDDEFLDDQGDDEGDDEGDAPAPPEAEDVAALDEQMETNVDGLGDDDDEAMDTDPVTFPAPDADPRNLDESVNPRQVAGTTDSMEGVDDDFDDDDRMGDDDDDIVHDRMDEDDDVDLDGQQRDDDDDVVVDDVVDDLVVVPLDTSSGN